MTSLTPAKIPRLLWFIIALAVGLRVALALAHPFTFPDSLDYDALAKSLLHGDGYQVNGLFASRMPGYPLLMAAIFACAPPSTPLILVLQGAAWGGVAALIYALTPRVTSLFAPLLAAFLVALDPLSIGFSAALLSETPFTLLFILALFLFKKLMEQDRFGLWIFAGITWGAAVYMRASALWLILPLAAWTAYKSPNRLHALRGALVAIAITFVTLLPWQTRNYSLFHTHFFRLTTLEGISLYEAVYPEADGSPKQDKITLPPDMQHLNEADRNDEWNKRAWHYILTDPNRMLHLALQKAARTWSPTLNASEFRNPKLQLVLAAWYIPLFLLSLLGLFTPNFPLKTKILLLIPILYFTAVHSLFLGSVRYRAPLMPLLCILAAAGVTNIANRFRRAKPTPDEVV